MLVAVATIASAIALLSGIAAVGDGHRFAYQNADILAGRKDAILYIWVTISSIFSLAHLAVLFNFGLEYHWAYKSAETPIWMLIHTGIASLLTSAHFYIKSELHDPVCREEYLWGKLRASNR